MPCHVRAAGRDDAAEAGRLFALMAAETAGLTPPSAALRRTMRRLIAREDTGLLLAEAPCSTDLEPQPRIGDGAAVGLCLVVELPDPWTGRSAAEIRALVVSPAHRRRGVGRALLSAAAAWARRRDCAYIFLLGESDNVQAHALYQHMGMMHKNVRYFELPL